MALAVVWTYWLCFPLLGAAVLGAVVMSLLYLRRVALPHLEAKIWVQQQAELERRQRERQLQQRRNVPTTGVAALPTTDRDPHDSIPAREREPAAAERRRG
jgi:hypothetical protein